MKVQITGTRNGLRWPPPGGVIDVLAVEAVDLIAGGLAEAVVEPEKVEKRPASRKGVETRKG